MRIPALALLALLISGGAQAEFGLHTAGHFGFGAMGGQDDDSYHTRDIGTFGIQVMPGYRLMGRSLLVGPLLDLRFIGQLGESPGTKDNTPKVDYGGRSFILGLAGMYDLAGISLLFSYDLLARHYYSNPDTTLKGSGIRFLLAFKFMENTSIDVQYISTNYKALSVNGQEDGLGANPIHHWDVGVGICWDL